MFLYEKIKDKIIIYKIEPNIAKIKKYQKQSFELCNQNLIYNAISMAPRSEVNCCLYQNNQEIIDWDYLNNSRHKMIPDNRRTVKISLFNNYYNGLLDNYTLRRIKKDKKHYGLMFSNSCLTLYPRSVKNLLGNDLILPDVMLLPDNLYILEAFKRRQFNLIRNDNINEQLRLYSPLIYVDEISVNDLVRISNMGLMRTNVEQAITEMELTTSLVKKKRKIDQR